MPATCLRNPALPAAPLIAVIDDDPDICASLHGLLRSVGYLVRTFPSAETYLDERDALAADCIVSDVQMPGGMSGLMLAEHLSGLGGKPPLILISAFADEAIQAVARRAGARALLKKPFDGGTLIALVAEAVA